MAGKLRVDVRREGKGDGSEAVDARAACERAAESNPLDQKATDERTDRGDDQQHRVQE